MEVSGCNITTKGKTQLLAGETTGYLVRENTHKTVLNQNVWTIRLASSPAQAEPISQSSSFTAEQLINEVRRQLASRSSLSIRQMTRTLISAFSASGYSIGFSDLQNGLQDYGVQLENSDVKKLFKYLDRSNTGRIDLADLLDELRG